MVAKNHYEVLGVSKATSQKDIKKAYQKLAKKWHPDVNKAPEAEARFKEIAEAYDVLSHDDKREAYEEEERFASMRGNAANGRERRSPFGEQTFTRTQNRGGGIDDDDLFGMFFRGAGAGQDRFDFFGGNAARAQLDIKLEQAWKGDKIRINIGGKDIVVTIPARSGDDSIIRLRGGGENKLSQSEELLLTIKISPHDYYKVDDGNLLGTLQVAPWQVVLGGSADVLLPDGSMLKLKIPAGFNADKRLRLPSKGLNRKDGSKGDILLGLELVVSERPTAEEKEIYEQLSKVSSFHARMKVRD